MTKNANGKVLLCATLLAALGAGACNEEADSVEDTEELQQVQTGKDSDAPFVASVKANGTGCPARTWTAKLAEDGQSFRILFTGFETEVDRRRSVQVKDCQLTINVTSPADQQYSVQSFGYTGYAYLQEGANAKISSVHYFQGSQPNKPESVAELKGPLDESYHLTSNVADADAAWSECGKQRSLNVRTTVRLQGSGGRSSSVSLAEIEGIKLAVRKCGDKPDGGPGPVPDGGPGPVPDGGPTPEVDAGPDGGPTPDTDGGPGPQPSSGPDIAEVAANGTGCPAGTSTVTIADDKKSFKVAFSAFEALASGSSTSIKDCTISIRTVTEPGKQVALKSYGLKTERKVGAGANARFQPAISIQGSASPASAPTDEVGPLEGPHTYRVNVAEADLKWTPCGTQRDINVRSLFRLSNGTSTTDSSIKALETDGFELITRSCTP